MPFITKWIVPKRVLFTKVTGAVTAPDLERYIAQIRQEVTQGTPPIYHISYSLETGKVEMSLKTLSNMVRAMATFSELKV